MLITQILYLFFNLCDPLNLKDQGLQIPVQIRPRLLQLSTLVQAPPGLKGAVFIITGPSHDCSPYPSDSLWRSIKSKLEALIKKTD